METRSFEFASPIPWYALVPLGVVLVFLAVRLYRYERGMVPGLLGKVLTVLRAALPLILLLLLLEPLFAVRWFENLKGRVIVLLDGSLSMTSTDDRRPDDEKIRLADALGLLPAGARDVSMQEMAVRTTGDAGKLAKAIEAAPALGNAPKDEAVTAFKTQHKAAFALVKAFQKDLNKFVSRKQRPSEVAALLTDLNDKFSAHVAIHADLAEQALDDLESHPQKAAGVEAYDRSSAELFNECCTTLMAAQQASDRLLAKSENKEVRDAVEKIDRMKREEIMVRVLKHEGRGVIEELSRNFHIECYQLEGRHVVPIAVDKVVASGKLAFECNGKSTDLATALRMAAGPAGEERETSAVVLLTDGQNNAGDDPEMAARELAGKKLPLLTIGIGSGEPPRDIAIAELDTSRVVYLGDEVHVELNIKYDGFQGASAPAHIEEGDAIIAEKHVPFPDGRRRTLAELAFIPEEVGSHTYSAVIPLQSGEQVKENNRIEFQVDVIDDKIRVLYAEGEPRWEYRFLKNLFLRDKTMDLNRIMLMREADELPRGIRSGQFPETREELFRYDVLILGDIPANRFFLSDLKQIRDFVAENGGVLVMICGPMFNPEGYFETLLGELMPVYPERVDAPEEVQRSIRYNGFRPVLTHEGENSPVTRISFDRLDNALIWEKLPPLHWHAFLGRPKQGAEVLLRAPGREKDDCVLLASQTYGMGKVLLLATDDTWHWRWKVGDKYFHKFWGQVMRWATAGKTSGRDRYVRIATTKRQYELGEAVEIEARVLGEDLKPLRDSKVQAQAARQDGRIEDISLEFVADSEGRYRGKFTGLETGRYTVRLVSDGLPGGTSEARVQVDVMERPNMEQVELFLNRPLLESMSKISNGRYFPAEEYRKLAQAIEPVKKKVPHSREIRLWTWPPILVLFTLVVCTEWVLRKKAGLM